MWSYNYLFNKLCALLQEANNYAVVSMLYDIVLSIMHFYMV